MNNFQQILGEFIVRRNSGISRAKTFEIVGNFYAKIAMFGIFIPLFDFFAHFKLATMPIRRNKYEIGL